ncbi:MAG: hypothetical protein E5Y10_03285 [Mesorhizobium sp.]|uniref:hypothetical protein n=1 Tax=Mesorhizobium sp. TaxID=1871066 RepID=UPI000FE8A9F4|nr:hypothetical protein [Mesorhizobium sp.]RWO56123.1 MAG: hypothetical protein EOS13_03490 [Mesorhizobium sp.]TIN39312.1 MAG: hypothetical protein E5Y13_14595 [Mesorhizobium sp.]TJU89605.1 MAG: hypothetical protein E5Y15_00175 [Mesorhizobium sp.]TJU93017.1 MAG: hypothetical protein E5Y10_03285 [Mesorhizobium sp.]
MPTIYNKRQNSDGLWEVYDDESEEAVVVDGMPLSGLDELEANEVIRKLKRGEVTSDNIPPTAQSGWPPTKDGI